MLIGYARVSILEQDIALQVDALQKARCDNIFNDTVSGATTQRPGLTDALSYVRKGDTLVVWRLDRLGRSLRHLIDMIADLEKHGVGLRSLQESINTTTRGGRLIFQIFEALAEFERNLIREKTQAGLKAARVRGRKGGRPKALDAKKTELAYQLYDAKKHTIKEICQMFGISKPSLYAYIKEIVNFAKKMQIANM